jgi:protein arginine N-methyltransferase 1
MYTTAGYGAMIADESRMQAYEAALRRVIQPQSVVLDLGCGSGIMAFLACRLGAHRVIAVEPDEVVQLARQIAAANGLDEQIEFLHGLSTAMEPPARCDVVVSDLRGVLPLHARHIPSIVDIRERWLADAGTQIPLADSIFAAVVESQSAWDKHFRGYTADVGVDLSPALRVCSGSLAKRDFGSEALLTEPALWASIDYRTVTSPNHEARLSWRARRDGTGHGIAVWFESILTDGVTLSNRPGEPPMIYGQMYFPWPQPVPLHRGDCLEARIGAHLIGDDYVWAWDTDVHAATDGRVTKTFRQSTLQGSVNTSEWLASRRLDAQTTLGPKGHAALEALRAMEKGAVAREISEALMERFPAQFAELPQSLSFVSGLQSAYGARIDGRS